MKASLLKRHPRSLRAAATLTMLGLLAACSGGEVEADPGSPEQPSASNDSPDEEGGAPSALPEAEGATEYPYTLATPWGETVLAERPERVVAVGGYGVDVQLLLELGVTPIAANETGVTFSPYLAAAGGDEIEQLLPVSLNPLDPAEIVAATEPDLLIAFDDLTDDYERLASIAPVLASDIELENYFDQSWQDQILLLGEALDLRQRAEEVIAEHDQFLDTVIAAHPEFAGRTVTYAIWYGADTDWGLTYATRPGTASESFFLEIGFEPNPLAESFASESVVSLEQLSLIDADVLILNDSSGGRIDELLEEPLFQRVPVVQEGNVVITSDPEDGSRNPIAWALVVQGPLAIEYVVDNLVPDIAGALE